MPITGQVVVAALHLGEGIFSALVVPAVDHVDVLTLGEQATVYEFSVVMMWCPR
jgi:hypothetical protein